jgi:transcriptional regulator with XRE-family HTH domain
MPSSVGLQAGEHGSAVLIEAQRQNKLLRLQRRLRGWSQEDVAAGLHRLAADVSDSELGVDAAMVGRWERGTRKPRPRYVRLLSTLFELPAEQLGFIEDGERELLPAPANRHGGEEATREFIVHMSALLGVADLPDGAMEPWERLSYALGQRTHADAQTVDHLEGITVALESLEATPVSSAALIGPVAGHLDAISLLLHGSPTARLRSRLCSLASETAGFASWLHWNVGDAARVAAYRTVALDAAREAGDRALGIALLASAVCQGPSPADPGARVDLLEGTADFPLASSTPSNRVWMAAKQADACAVMGRGDDCRRALDRAQALLRRVEDEGEERRPRFMVLDANWLAGERGASLAKLGRTGEARELLLPVLASLGPTAERDRVWLTAALARTYLLDGEPEAAARLAHEAFSRACMIGLEPVQALVRDLRDDLLEIDRSPAVVELDEEIRDATAAQNPSSASSTVS